ADEAAEWINADKDAKLTLGASPENPESFVRRGHHSLPWWAWIVTGSALGLAVLAGILQVTHEKHRYRVRLRTIKGGEGIEEARRAITRTFGSEEMEEALRGVRTPSASVPTSSNLSVPSVPASSHQAFTATYLSLPVSSPSSPARVQLQRPTHQGYAVIR
ncbi:unnamed protein product, partial [Effrenium voratum]